MTIFNIKNNRLEIIIETSSPDEQRDWLLQALSAAVRWNGACDENKKDTVNNKDGENLIQIARLMEALTITKTISK